MPIINCPNCGNQVSDRATSCPHCFVRNPRDFVPRDPRDNVDVNIDVNKGQADQNTIANVLDVVAVLEGIAGFILATVFAVIAADYGYSAPLGLVVFIQWIAITFLVCLGTRALSEIIKLLHDIRKNQRDMIQNEFKK